MYYITNQNNQIIAIDPSLLSFLEAENMDDLYRDIALGEIHFSALQKENKVTITKAKNKETYDAKNTYLSGMLGDMTLVQIQIPTEGSMLIEDSISRFSLEKEDEIPFVAEDKNELVEDPLSPNITEEEEISLFDDALISIKDSDDLQETDTPVLDTPEEENDDLLFDLLLPDAAEETIEKITITKDAEIKTEDGSQTPIVIDIKKISQSIGISTEDYNTFLNEYIDTALSLEEDLQSSHQETRSNAIGTLSHLSNVLHLSAASEILTQIDDAAAEKQSAYIASFYATLGRLTTSSLATDNTEAPSIPIIDSDTEVKADDAVDIGNIDMYEEEPLSIPETESTATTGEGFGSIDLDNVKPIHFDFQMEQAASELSLPVELIEEFVHDFIEQAHTETEKMLAAYEKGDLEAIQKIGHLLKGTSSNLRITPLSDTLYEIQFCEDSNKLEELIKRYWGHFLSLETQINIKRK